MIINGLNDLQNDLLNMAAEMEFGSSVDKALTEGAKPIEEQMIANASSDPKVITGALRGSIHTGKVKKRREGGKAITIGVHHAEMSAYYANPVEYGHGGPAPAPAHPFVRPAFDTRVDDAYKIMQDVLSNALAKR